MLLSASQYRASVSTRKTWVKRRAGATIGWGALRTRGRLISAVLQPLGRLRFYQQRRTSKSKALQKQTHHHAAYLEVPPWIVSTKRTDPGLWQVICLLHLTKHACSHSAAFFRALLTIDNCVPRERLSMMASTRNGPGFSGLKPGPSAMEYVDRQNLIMMRAVRPEQSLSSTLSHGGLVHTYRSLPPLKQ